jgi:lysozyme
MNIKIIINEEINNINNIVETKFYLNRILNRLSFLNEDGKTKPDMEWDFTNVKSDLDSSKKWVKTKEDVISYLKTFIEEIKSLPLTFKKKITKYVLYSFIGILSFNQVQSLYSQIIDNSISSPIKTNVIKKDVLEKIRKPSQDLFNHLKYEEGSVKKKGEPVLNFYDLGDGAYTVGYGHAVFSDPNRGSTGGDYPFVPNYKDITPNETKITKPEAEKLLQDDMLKASEGLNSILDKWEKQDIKPRLTQGMYDAMVSMIYNMGLGNFRMTDFIQYVKKGDLLKAKEEIKNVSSQMFSKFPGLKNRREKESEMFKVPKEF